MIIPIRGQPKRTTNTPPRKHELPFSLCFWKKNLKVLSNPITSANPAINNICKKKKKDMKIISYYYMYWYAKVEKQKEEKLGIALMRKPINTLQLQGWSTRRSSDCVRPYQGFDFSSFCPAGQVDRSHLFSLKQSQYFVLWFYHHYTSQLDRQLCSHYLDPYAFWYFALMWFCAIKLNCTPSHNHENLKPISNT